MFKIYSKTFNPEVLYVFDHVNIGPTSSQKHTLDFLELTIFLSGESFVVIEDEEHHLQEKTVLVLNPGVSHMEYTTKGMNNSMIHIGLRHFNFPGFQKDFFPLNSTIIQLGNYKDAFFETCDEIIIERNERRPGYELILKALVYKLIIYLFRDDKTTLNEDRLLSTDQKKQKFVNDIRLYIENHYAEDLSLDYIAQHFHTNSSTISRSFKDFFGDTPINYLIDYRLTKAKNNLQTSPEASIKDIAKSVGYDDPLYFSKLFKKRYGQSPTYFVEKSELDDNFKNEKGL